MFSPNEFVAAQMDHPWMSSILTEVMRIWTSCGCPFPYSPERDGDPSDDPSSPMYSEGARDGFNRSLEVLSRLVGVEDGATSEGGFEWHKYTVRSRAAVVAWRASCALEDFDKLSR